ncbi:hypothetical protein MKX01_000408 [Papaver californicum]|nr:hypothetical protein MKX01_000408 [Papaver californicum]
MDCHWKMLYAVHITKGILFQPSTMLPKFWNHDYFWGSMKPDGGGKPSGELLEMIERDFGSYEKFITDFKAAASTQFGAGWAWLAYAEEDKKLVIVKTSNAVNPLVQGQDYTPILTIDVWEVIIYT